MLKKIMMAVFAFSFKLTVVQAQKTVTTPTHTAAISLPKVNFTDSISSKIKNIIPGITETIGNALQTFLPIQFKYSNLLNSTVQNVSNLTLYKTIDEWYGTRYRYGGTTHRGIDCSAFMQVLANAFGFIIPRTAREQYRTLCRITKTELKEGDLVFFNTRGGISHVGMYLQNNKFVHSSSSKGVMISDLDDTYWSSKYRAAARIAN
jgi:hypothetical protein